MFIGNVHYVTSHYNENKFKALLESQLSTSQSFYPSNELVEQAIAAYLDYKDSHKEPLSEEQESFFSPIPFMDKRDYTDSNVIGNPLDAINAFCKIIFMYKMSNKA